MIVERKNKRKVAKERGGKNVSKIFIEVMQIKGSFSYFSGSFIFIVGFYKLFNYCVFNL